MTEASRTRILTHSGRGRELKSAVTLAVRSKTKRTFYLLFPYSFSRIYDKRENTRIILIDIQGEHNSMKEDIFDKIMKLPGLRILTPFYKKYKEMLLYLFFGGLAFVISILSYGIADVVLGINELIANIISWILAVLFAFFTNRVWVFQSATHSGREFAIQMANFFGGRVVTLIVEEVIILVFITILGFPSIPVKVAAQIVVIVLNYIISKFWVFKKKNEDK